MIVFDFSLQTAIAGTFASSAVLAATLFYVWRLDPGQQAVRFWALAFTAQSLRMLAQFAVTLGHPQLFAITDLLFALVVGLIWLGCRALEGRRPYTGKLVIGLSLALLCSVLGTLAEAPFVWRSMPLYLLSGSILIAAGVSLNRMNRSNPGVGYRWLAVLFVLLGIHYFDYPFLRTVAWFAPIGFSIAAWLMLGIGAAMLVLTQRRQQFSAMTLARQLQAQMLEQREMEGRYRAIFEKVGDGILVVTREGRMQMANSAAARMFGLGDSAEKILTTPLNELYEGLIREDGETVSYTEYPLRRALKYGQSSQGETYGFRRQDGSLIWVVSSAQPLYRDGETQPYAAILSITDITEAKEAELALRQSEAKFRAIFDQSFQLVGLLDTRGIMLDANNTALEFGGLKREDVIGQYFWDTPWWSNSPERDFLREAIASASMGKRIRFETAHPGPDGRLHHIDFSLTPVVDTDGVVRMLIPEGREITQLKEVQEAQKLSEAKFSGAFHASLDYITISYLDTGELIEVNEAFERMTGWTRAEAIGRTSTELGVWPDFETRQRAVDLIRSQGFVHDYPCQIRTKHGDLRDGLLNASLIPVGPVTYLLGVVRDVTEQKQAADRLRESEEKFSSIFRESPQPLVVTAVADKRFVDTNAAWETMFGFSRDEVIGHTSEEFGLWVDDAERTRLYQQLQGQRSIDRVECRYRNKQGQEIYCLSSGRIFNLGGQECIIWNMADITIQHQARQQMERMNAELEERIHERTTALESANRELAGALRTLQQAQDELVRSEKLAALGALVAGVAHELNTPIGNSVTVASTLHERTEEFASLVTDGTLRRSSLQQYLESARTASDLLMRSLNQARSLVASFKQVAVDQTSDQRRKFDLREVVGEVLTTLSPTVRKTSHRITMEIPDGILMDSYPGPLGQIVTNFITNALIHAFEGRQNGEIRIVATEAADGMTTLTVSDDGRGIPEEHLHRIFDPFFTTKLGKGGSGLGLHIVYNIATRVLGGRVSASSLPGSGTSFVLTMPLIAPSRAMPAIAEE